MNMPFYVAPEQVMKDRADYARKGIATLAACGASTPLGELPPIGLAGVLVLGGHRWNPHIGC